MENPIEPIIFYLSALLMLVVALILFSSKGHPIKFIKSLTTERGKRIGLGWLIVISLSFLMAFLFFIFNAPKVQAEESLIHKFISSTEYSVGVDDTGKPSPQCTSEGDYSQTLTSNINFKVYFAEGERLSLGGIQAHASCVANQDRNTYDATGAFLKWDVTNYISMSISGEYFYDYREWVTAYNISYTVAESADKKSKLSISCTMRDIKERSLESQLNYKGCGPSVSLRF